MAFSGEVASILKITIVMNNINEVQGLGLVWGNGLLHFDSAQLPNTSVAASQPYDS